MEKQQYIGSYRLKQSIGEGSFGQIFEATKDGQTFAIKTENFTIVKPMLQLEYKLFLELHQQQTALSSQKQLCFNGFDFPQVYQYTEQEHFAFMAMEKLDTTLQDLANLTLDNKVPKDVLILIMYNSLQCLQALHQLGYLYRDVKPANFMLKNQELLNSKGRLYLIDLGLCKQFMRPDTGEHIKMKTNKKMIGTPVFCSINTHKGIENSRRDDLESWVYMIVYLVKKLPWEDYSLRKDIKGVDNLEGKQQSYEKIAEVKQATNMSLLIKQEEKIPTCLAKIIQQIYRLAFQERPNYESFYQLMQDEYNKLTGRKTLLKDLFLNTKTAIDQNKALEKKNIKIVFKVPTKKDKGAEKTVVQQETQREGEGSN